MHFDENGLIASITRESFFEFVKEFWSTVVSEAPVFNWHVKFLCDELQFVAERVFRGEDKLYDMVINVPPGSTKSTICSQMFPAWCWTRMASAKFICGSYAYAVALKDSIRTRDIVQSDRYQKCFGIQLREDENTKGLFVNTQMGSRLSVGIGGMMTGFHGHFLIVDDPLSPEESFSEKDIRAANRWMSLTLPSRKVDKRVTPLILIMQRLHQSDPSGEILSRGGDVRHICLPGELTERVSPPEAAAFYQDGLLDPIRMPRVVLDAQRKDLGEYGYASQILQYPVPLGGGMFETDKMILEDLALEKFDRVVRAWDKAGTEDGGMYSVGVKMAVTKHNSFWVLDVKRGQWRAEKRERMIRRTAEEDGPEVEVLLEVEGGSGGKESGENTVANLAGYRVVAIHVTGTKEARAYPYASQVGGKNVHVLRREWTEAYIEELKFFPHSTYKDQVDASSLGFNRIAKKKMRIGGAW